MIRKFNVGDLVKCSSKCPKKYYFKGTRIITFVWYNRWSEHTEYDVTFDSHMRFSYELEKVE